MISARQSGKQQTGSCFFWVPCRASVVGFSQNLSVSINFFPTSTGLVIFKVSVRFFTTQIHVDIERAYIKDFVSHHVAVSKQAGLWPRGGLQRWQVGYAGCRISDSCRQWPLQVCAGPPNAQCEGESLEVVMVSRVRLCAKHVHVWMEANADLLVEIRVVWNPPECLTG